MVWVFGILNLCLVLVMAVFVVFLGVYGMAVVYHVWTSAFTTASAGHILAGVCMICAAGFLVSPPWGRYRERMGFFLVCLTLYCVGSVTFNPLLEWLVVASCGVGLLLCQRLLEIGRERCRLGRGFVIKY